jgi:hypothetical protein
MDRPKQPAWGGSRISRRQMLAYGLAGMAGVAGGLLPAPARGDTNKILGTKTGGRSVTWQCMMVMNGSQTIGKARTSIQPKHIVATEHLTQFIGEVSK